MVEIGLDVAGRFTIQKRRDGVVIEERSWNNLILDQAFNNLIERLHGTNAYLAAEYLFLGTGTTEPTRADTGLETRGGLPGKRLAGITTSGWMDGINGNRYADVNLRYEFGVGEATGTWTEIGTADTAAYERPFNRALIRDENDWPTPLKVQATDAMTVHLRLRLREGLGFPMRIDMPLPDGSTRATVTPLESAAYTHTGNSNVWKAGYANARGTLLAEDRSAFRYTSLPWPYPSPGQTLYPVESYHHHLSQRTTRMSYYVGASSEDVFIHGVGLGPGDDWIYRIMFDAPIPKVMLDSLEFDITIAFYRTDTD